MIVERIADAKAEVISLDEARRQCRIFSVGSFIGRGRVVVGKSGDIEMGKATLSVFVCWRWRWFYRPR